MMMTWVAYMRIEDFDFMKDGMRDQDAEEPLADNPVSGGNVDRFTIV